MRDVRVLGIDPGLTRCGLGAVEGAVGTPLRLIDMGVIRTPADADLGARLVAIEQGVEAWLARTRPDAVAVERGFGRHNVPTGLGTAQADAVACAARRGVPVSLHTRGEVKAAITGSGQADKATVRQVLCRPATPGPTRWPWPSPLGGGPSGRCGCRGPTLAVLAAPGVRR